ncbi:hypothetical protein ONE63_008828 [Megalurothrips usitatus]|uniref:Uncharacterized protein n=1 Tax=Megalurothrips usitatus TaxID=439358 RepID=A0AAV7XMF5_9NEOP|nr:hypothetical protein ONE63_008828 [Megalurothrips usitatus]
MPCLSLKVVVLALPLLLAGLSAAAGYAVNKPMLHRGFTSCRNCEEAGARTVSVDFDDDVADMFAALEARAGGYPAAYNYPLANEIAYDEMRREGRASHFPKQHPALAAVDSRRHRSDFQHPNVRLVSSFSDMGLLGGGGGGGGAVPVFEGSWEQEPRAVFDNRIRGGDLKNKPMSAGNLIQILKDRMKELQYKKSGGVGLQ